MFKGFEEPWVFRSHGHSVQSQRISGFWDLDFKDCGLREFRVFSCLGMFGGVAIRAQRSKYSGFYLVEPYCFEELWGGFFVQVH